ncbi:FGGY family carbohydrate kinase [Cryobacterium sp. PH29-G1]|uniref:xylulokinase n=1 Tax=Cryobacterium sp. PH29-G1 TaxID=3046211 RepID=UPI0024BB160A|nr:FGGY family carbohydrate kinase [Cryobacterium sp. PH29-G1]MDJ0350093.1 FGGY family carbohydrate kinase [Cryobacterium sp. PH29-G1]
MTLVAGVDSSTQSCKVVIRDADTGALVRSGRASHPDGTEVDPAAWWDALQQAVADAGGLDDVAAISIAAQQHGMVVLDLDGGIIRPALLWNDTRSAPAAHDLLAEVGAEDYAARTGVVPVASFTASKLRWLRDAEPANAARVAAVALPHDWLSWRLRGFGPADTSADGPADTNPLGPVLTALTTDPSDASGTAYWSPSTGEYDLDLFELALGHGAILPRVLGADEQAGVASQRGGTDAVWLPAGIVVAAGAGDNAGAALGLGASAGDVIVSIGTSGTVFAVTNQPTTDTSGSVAGFASASADFLPLVATLNAARVLDSIAALLGVDYDELGRLALEAQPGAQGLVLQPYFAGERTPNLPEATASVFGMTLASTTRPNLARAAIEGMLCGLADGLDAVQSLHVSVTRILLIGGAAQNPAVRAIAAQVFAAPIVVPTPGEYVADGGAVQAAWALTGTRPTWAAAIAAEPNPDFQPVIRTQYAAHATA